MRFTHALLFVLFFFLSLGLFARALGGEFIMDDWGYIAQNPWVTGAAGPWRFWSTLRQTDYWPLSYTFYWLFWKLFGLNPVGYHLVNVAMHALNGVLVFLLARECKLRWPIWVALFFLVHPLHVQAVAWIIQFKTLLATALALGVLLADRRGRDWVALGLFGAALLAKTSVIFLPLVMLGQRREKGRLWPFFLLAVLGGAVTLYVNDLNFHDRDYQVFHLGVAERALLVVQNVIFYAKTFFFPVRLSYMYPLRVPEVYGAGLWLIPAGVLMLALIAFLCRNKEHRFFILSYLALLAPCLGLVAIPNMKLSLVADHWAYLPDVFMVMWVGKWARIPDTPWGRVGAAVPLVILSALTFVHAGSFAGEEEFWTRAREMNPRHAAPYYNLGVVYGKQNQTSASVAQYKLAIQRDLTHHRAWFNLGRAYFLNQDYEKSEECFLHALKLNPQLTDAYAALAAIYQKVGSPDRARAILSEGLRANPNDATLTERLNQLR